MPALWRFMPCTTISSASIRRSKSRPEMAAGVTDRLWEMNDVVDVLDAFGASRKQAA
jgi:hypothetical protein